MAEKELAIEFAIYLTGHDKETIEQMFSDWGRMIAVKDEVSHGVFFGENINRVKGIFKQKTANK